MKVSWNILSKYKTELYGFSILWIMLFHGLIRGPGGALDKKIDFLTSFIKHGNCGVETFLFLSGIFLYYSMKKSTVKAFYEKRLIRIYLPLLFIDGIYWAYTCLYQKYDLMQFLKNITGYSFWFGNVRITWFVSLILLLYLFYPVVFKYILEPFSPRKSFILISIICIFIYGSCFFLNKFEETHHWYTMTEIAWTRIPVFLLGCYVGPFVYRKKIINQWLFVGSFFVLILGVVFFYHPFGLVKWYRVQYLLVGPVIAIWVAFLLDILNNHFINKALAFCGAMSLELYLSHFLFQNFIFSYGLYGADKIHNFHIYLGTAFIGAFIISTLVSKISNKMACRLKKMIL